MYLTHRRGRGKISASSEADSLTLIDRHSILEGKSSVWSSSVKGSRIINSTVTASVIENSVIENSLITGGQIINSSIKTELVADYALIKDSEISGSCRIAHTAYIENCRIANFTVTGDARLIGWQDFTDGKEAYISYGEWRRPPRILYLNGGLTITESVAGFAYCGCRIFSINHWLKIGNRYGAKLGLTPDEVQEIREFLHSLA